MWRIPAAVMAVAAVTVVVLPAPALAHEHRTVGPYEIEIGWDIEPAYTGSPNAVFLAVEDPRTTPATPVEGLAATLKVEVRHGGLTRSLVLAFESDEDDPGTYRARFVPTRAGDYTFDLVGAIGDLDVQERFESGPGRFASMSQPGAVQYPDEVPAGGDLRDRIDALDSSIGSTRALALAAIALAIALPLGVLWRVRTRR